MIHIDFEKKAKEVPGHIAIEQGTKKISYQGLDAGATQLAHTLRRLGVRKDVIVSVLLSSGINLVRSLLAVFKAGGIYLPADITFAPKRLIQMFSQTETQIAIIPLNRQAEITALFAALNIKIQYLVTLDEEGQVQVLSYQAGSFREHTLPQETENEPLPVIAPNDSNYIFYTSGSTGEAKAILGQHKSLAHFIHWEIKEFGINESARVSQLIQFTFDASLRDIFVPLCSGGTLCIPEQSIKSNILSLIQWIDASRITLIHCVPSLIRLILKELQIEDTKPGFNSLRHLLMSGELLYAKDIHTFRETIGQHVELVNFYGPSETTLIKTFHRIGEVPASPSQPIHVGKPIADTAVIILNNDQLCRIGETGEIFIKTPFTTKGYFRNEELTRTVFVQNPLVKDREDIIYRTGDLGRYLHDRSVEVLGRTDDQVKINGIRIELNEIKQAVLEMKGISEAVVVPVKNHDQQELACYYTGTDVTEAALRAHLKTLLNESYIPYYFVKMDRLPLNTNGKVDKKQLPRPIDMLLNQANYEEVEGEVERKLETIWEDILGVSRTGRKISFFSIGGNSLKVAQLISRVYREFEINLRMNEVYTYPAIAQLAALIERSERETFHKITPAGKQEYYDLSYGQRRLWVLDQLNDGKTAYNMSNAFHIKGSLNKQALSNAFTTLVNRHEILRTSFVTVEDEPKQLIHQAENIYFDIPFTNLQQTPNRENTLQELVTADAATVFDLEKGALLQVKLYQLADDEHVLMIVMHHIISDGWSIEVFFNEVIALYNALPLPQLAFQYKDYAHWQQLQLSGEHLQQHRDHWHQRFADTVPRLELFTDMPRPVVKTYNGSAFECIIPKQLSQGLTELAHQHNATLFMVLLAALKTLLYRYSHQEDIVVGTPVAGRNHPDLENQIGFYVNTLALRSRLSGQNGFTTLLESVRKTVIADFEHQLYPFDLLVNELDLERETNRSPLFDVMLVLHQSNGKALQALPDNLYISGYRFAAPVCKFDLVLNVAETENGLHLMLEYNTDLFRKGRAANMLTHYLNVLQAAINDCQKPISQIEYLSAEERNKILYAFNNTIVPYAAEKTIHGLFEEKAAATPTGIALRMEGNEMSYDELNRQANRLARYLIDKGVQHTDNIGLITGRGFDMIIGMLGILKAGAAYVPIDPTYPVDRQLYVIRNSGVDMVLTDNDYEITKAEDAALFFVPVLPDGLSAYPDTNPGIYKCSKELAYTIYTSGSTGRPKGVMIAHHSAVNLIQWVNKEFCVSEQDRLLFITSMCFDLSVYDIFGILAAGGTVVIARQEEVADVEKLQQLMLDEQITFWDSVPTTMNYLVTEIEETGIPYLQQQLRVVFMSGDWIPVSLPQKIRQYFPKAAVISLGGATEGTVWSNYYPIWEDMSGKLSVPYGRPIDNNFFYILDEHLNPVPQGVVGELFIGGAGVAQGYANDEAKTTASFVPDPFNNKLGGRMYRTGDLGRMMEDWNMEFMGRKDHQVKIRGFRVELGEIKNVLLQHEDIKETVIIAETDEASNKYLVAYIVAHQEPNIAALREYVARQLPEYMIPGYFIGLDAMPLTSNGKIDLKALPKPEQVELSTGLSYTPPRNATEQVLAGIWQEVLGKDQIGVQDNFFEIGGHSLNAARVMSRIAKQLKVKLALRSMFLHPTIERLSVVVSNSATALQEEIMALPVQEHYSLSHAQKRLWLLDQMEEGLTAYHISRALKISGQVDTEALEKAFAHLLERHESLRTRFSTAQGTPVQKVFDPAQAAFKITCTDLRYTTHPEEEANTLITAWINRSFDLEQDTLLRVSLLRLQDEEYVFLFLIHHIISDGWSLEVLTNEVMALYHYYANGIPHGLTPLKFQYRDYAAWHNRELAGGNLEKYRQYWWNRLSGAPILDFPADMPRPAVKTYAGGIVSFTVNEALTEHLREIGRQNGSSLFMALLAAVKVLLYRFTGQEDITVGSVHAGREHADLENQIGLYANTLVLRTALAGSDNFTQVLHKVKESVLGAYEYQAYPFDLLVSDLHLDRDQSRSPLFDIYVDLINVGAVQMNPDHFSGLKVTEFDAGDPTSKYDISFRFFDAGSTITAVIEYNTDLFYAETIELTGARLLKVLDGLAQQPKHPITDITFSNNGPDSIDQGILEETFDFSF